jgi:hypothetical protein
MLLLPIRHAEPVGEQPVPRLRLLSAGHR